MFAETYKELEFLVEHQSQARGKLGALKADRGPQRQGILKLGPCMFEPEVLKKEWGVVGRHR